MQIQSFEMDIGSRIGMGALLKQMFHLSSAFMGDVARL